MSFLTRIVVAALISLTYLSGGVKSLLSLSSHASTLEKDANKDGTGATGIGCGLYIPKK